MMANMQDETDRSIAALQAVRLIRQHFGSGTEGVDRIKDIAGILRASDDGMGTYGGLCRNVADAIEKAFAGGPEKDDPVEDKASTHIAAALKHLGDNDARDATLMGAMQRWLNSNPNR